MQSVHGAIYKYVQVQIRRSDVEAETLVHVHFLGPRFLRLRDLRRWCASAGSDVGDICAAGGASVEWPIRACLRLFLAIFVAGVSVVVAGPGALNEDCDRRGAACFALPELDEASGQSARWC